MTNLMEPRTRGNDDSAAADEGALDGELASLIRRWTTTQQRDARHGARASGSHGQAGAPTLTAPEPVGPEQVGPRPTYVVGTTPTTMSVPHDPFKVAGQPRSVEPPVRLPVLPQRVVGDQAEHVDRVALLVDARRVPADVASALLARLGERGAVNVCRAYADWNRADLGDWAGQMRREGLHSFHHFSDDDDQALVAMAIDAVDIARDAAVDEVVIAGDLTSALPLVHRLHAAGVRVVAVGAGAHAARRTRRMPRVHRHRLDRRHRRVARRAGTAPDLAYDAPMSRGVRVVAAMNAPHRLALLGLVAGFVSRRGAERPGRRRARPVRADDRRIGRGHRPRCRRRRTHHDLRHAGRAGRRGRGGGRRRDRGARAPQRLQVRVRLAHAGTTDILQRRVSDSGEQVRPLTWDDESGAVYGPDSPAGTYRPDQPLAVHDGTSPAGRVAAAGRQLGQGRRPAAVVVGAHHLHRVRRRR